MTATLTPYWLSRLIDNEPVLPVAGREEYTLWCPAEKLLTVRNYYGEEYVQGRDYELNQGNLMLLPNGKIKTVPTLFSHTPIFGTPFIHDGFTHDGRPIRMAEDFEVHKIFISYESMCLPVAPGFINRKNLFSLTQSGQTPHIIFCGDSITAGSSATLGQSFVSLLTQRLSGVKVHTHALPGKNILEATETVSQLLTYPRPTVVVLAFGMNDAIRHKNITAQIFAEAHQYIMQQILNVYPQVHFLLIAGMRANPEWRIIHHDMFDQYNSVMCGFSQQNKNVTLFDFSGSWENILSRKTFYDLSTNGVNHPGNFIHKLYADGIEYAIS